MSKLTAKQESFAQGYMHDGNATQAAIRAGYSEKGAGQKGHELLKKVEIAARVAELWKEKFSRNNIDGDAIMRELATIAFGHPGFFLAFPGGLRVYEKLDALKTLAKLRGLADEGVSDEERARSIRGHLEELEKATFVDPPTEPDE